MAPTDPFTSTLQDCLEVFMRHSIRNLILFSRQRGLSMSQLGALVHIHTEICSGVGNLGDQLGVTTAAASQLVERLVQQEFILRTEDPDDRRVKKLVLTDRGKQILEESMHARLGWVEELSGTLSAGEKEQVTIALKTLTEKTLQLEPPAEIDN